MKRIILLICTIFFVQTLSAQVSRDILERNTNTNVRLAIKDAKTAEPISWASVYLVPVGDTTITHFALSDEKGNVLLKEVPVGRYEVNAEMIGYTPHKKEYGIQAHWEAYDLGIIRLEENPEHIDAASISAVGNPIIVKKDTIEFNAAAFTVGENAMLEDLLKKMPGMEVGADGTVMLNGEKIDKITVGGRTFFFSDPTAALKSLPAKIVEKIIVSDKVKDEAAGEAFATKSEKEKVMDVELKEEYTKGWFGNARLGGGSTLTPETDNALIDDRGLLYNGNAMVTGYTEKDQIVVVGNAFNALNPGESVRTSERAATGLLGAVDGLTSTAQTGVNYNTSRIKGMETTVNVSYRNNSAVEAQESSRTTFMQDASDLLTKSSYNAKGHEDEVWAMAEIKDLDNEKYYFSFKPNFGYTTASLATTRASASTSGDSQMNSSESSTALTSDKIHTHGLIYGGLKNLGKENRNVVLGFDYNFFDINKLSHESSLIQTPASTILKDITYNGDNKNLVGTLRLNYSEPITDKWIARMSLISTYMLADNISNASNPDGTHNEFYSSQMRNIYNSEMGMLTFQYSNERHTAQFGATIEGVQNEVKAKSIGIETTAGKGKWLTNWAPYLNYYYTKDYTSLQAGYNGATQILSPSSITPSLNISNLNQIRAGNIYLEPEYGHNFYVGLTHTDIESYSYVNLYMMGTLTPRSIVNASWMDAYGVRYAVPVNSPKPESYGYLGLVYNRPFGKQKKLSFTVSGVTNYTGNFSYQAKQQMKGFDLESFDYGKFMADFWGDASGNRFYSGESGFAESRTNIFNWGGQFKLAYNGEKLFASAGFATQNQIAKYSLDPTANMNTWDSSVMSEILYTPGKGWEIQNDLNYNFYHGYTAGFGRPEVQWDLGISKAIKSVTLGLKVSDILNQTRNMNRIVTADYVEDRYKNVLGRYFLFNVTFNFGKVNAKKNAGIEKAMKNML